MGNMSAEDILDALGGYGSVNLKRGKFTLGASPGLRGLPELWKVTVTLHGYNGSNGPVYLDAQGTTIREAAEAVYAALESYVFSEKFTDDRKRYLDQHAFYQKRFDEAPTHARTGFNAIHPPGLLLPPIIWGEARGGTII